MVSSPPTQTRHRWAVTGMLVLVMLAGALRLSDVWKQPVNKDEVFSYIAARGMLVHGKPVFEATEYPYGRAIPHTWVLSRTLAWFGDSIVPMRILGVLFSLGTLLVYALIARRWSGWPWVLAGVLILGLSRWESYHAVSARMYAMLQFFFMLAVLVAVQIVEDPRWRRFLVLGGLLLLCVAVHHVVAPTLPLLLGGLVLVSWGRHRLPLLAGGLALVLLGIWIGWQVDYRPVMEVPRESYGTWNLSVGNPLRNAGIGFLERLNDRAPLLPWLSLLAGAYALARRERTLGFVAIVALVGGAATNAGIRMHIDRYFIHLFPLLIALGLAALERLAADALARADSLGELAGGVRDALQRHVGRFLGLPAPLLAAAAGVVLVAVGIGADLLLGQPFAMGVEQWVLVGAGVLALAAVALAPAWQRAAVPANRALQIAVLAGMLLALPQWARAVGPTRHAPVQDEVIGLLQGELREGDRLLTTEHMIPYYRLRWQPTGFLSQKLRGQEMEEYTQPTDWVTGLPFVDSAAELDGWLSGAARTFVYTDMHFELHVAPELQRRVRELELFYEPDPRTIEAAHPNPEWPELSEVVRVYVYRGDG